ncbi:MAG: hypothetical protein K9I94_01040 [Bacteroidales bacterium]|nr:hypothetical protein [Bacteroidales bacterium]
MSKGNTIKKQKKAGQTKTRTSKVGASVTGVFKGHFLTSKEMRKLLPFFLYLTVLAIIYITNNYKAEQKIIEISETKEELKKLRYEYITTKSQLMYHTQPSQVSQKLDQMGVKESTVPPYKIYIKD